MRSWQGVGKADTRLRKLDLQLHAKKLTNEEKMELNLVPPTDEFIEKLAKKQGINYTKGRDKTQRFYGDDDEPIYPPNNGVVGYAKKVTLEAGAELVDRYGSDMGSFVSPKGTPFPQRALPKSTNKDNYHVFQVIKNIDNVEEGITAAWFNQPGGGVQFKLPDKICNLKEYIKEVDRNDV